MILSINSAVKLSLEFRKEHDLSDRIYYVNQINSDAYDYSSYDIEDVYIEMDYGDSVYVYGLKQEIQYKDLLEC